MNQQSYRENGKSSKGLKGKWFKGETKRELYFPVPLQTVKERLTLAFRSAIKESRGFLFSTKKYEGYLDNNKVTIKFTSSGKVRMTFHMVGELFDDPNGTRMELSVSNRPLIYIGLIVGVMVLVSLKGIRTGLIFGVVFAVVNYFLIAWHRSSAADSISSQLNMIISRTDSNARR